MNKYTDEFTIKSVISFNNGDKEENISDSWNVYTSNHIFKQIFGKKVKESGTYLKKKKVIKITSHDTGASVYRIWNGAPWGAQSKDTIFLDDKAKYDLIDDENKDKKTTKLTLSKTSKYKFYLNHHDHNVRVTFKLAVWSVIIGSVSFVIGITSLIIGIISILR